MFHRTSGVTSLKAGCRRLQLPDDAALELVRFLQVKRVHDEFVPSTTKSCNMSPGAAMDKLWHFMLLNTDVSRCVHDLVGGVVRHVGTDEDDLDDNAKRMQRLYAMNIMAREGCQPDVRFWADPDTNMSFIYPVKQPHGPPLYVCSDMTAAEQAELTAHLAKLYSNKQSSISSSPAAPAPAGDISLHHSPADLNSSRLNQANDANVAGNEPEAAQEPPAERRGCSIKTITVVNVRDGRMFLVDVSESATWSATVAQLKQVAAAELSVPAAQVRLAGIKRSAARFTVDVLSDSTQVSSGQVVRVLLPNIKPPALPTAPFGVHISTLTGKRVSLVGKLAPWMLVMELKQVVQDVEGIPPDQQRLIFDGHQLDGMKSLKQCNIKNGDVVHLVWRLSGC